MNKDYLEKFYEKIRIKDKLEFRKMNIKSILNKINASS